jgi:hypothetical protein
MAAQQKPQHICYYSNKCEWSRTFLTEIANTPYKSEFMYVCVDPSPNRPALPTWLKKVPTLIVKGRNEPLVDSEVMNWLFERRLKDGAAHRPGTGGGGGGDAMDEPEPFMNLEMGARASDIYSFLDSDGSAQGGGGARIQHNFEFINGAGGGPGGRQQATIMTNHNPNRSKKEELFDAQMEAYQRERSAGMPQMVMRQ